MYFKYFCVVFVLSSYVRNLIQQYFLRKCIDFRKNMIFKNMGSSTVIFKKLCNNILNMWSWMVWTPRETPNIHYYFKSCSTTQEFVYIQSATGRRDLLFKVLGLYMVPCTLDTRHKNVYTIDHTHLLLIIMNYSLLNDIK